ncbi:MAG: cell wall hydrolase, partial [Proteobacteria bacterium]|nr:cell wall hydrolase [Pseudomonadota bacterium]
LVYWGQTLDPTYGALWYHADYVNPYWRGDFIQGRQIGRHIFYSPAPRGTQIASRIQAN